MTEPLDLDAIARDLNRAGAITMLPRSTAIALIERVRVAEADAEQFRLMGASADAARAEWQRRALAAEARIAAVEALCDGEPEVTRWIDGQRLIDRDKVAAALDGDA